MSDENVEEVVTEEQPKVEPKTDAKQVKAGDKKFTDGDMAQLRRTLTKQHTDAEAAWTSEKETLQSKLDAQNETITGMVELLKKDLELDDDYLDLLGEKEPAEQLAALLKKVEKSQKRDIPRTPKGDGDRNQKFAFPRRNPV